MSKAFTILSLTMLLLLTLVNLAQAQSVWPGDVNNNGIVNYNDLLYWGVAHGTTGSARSSRGISFEPHSMPSPWPWTFPGVGVNYCYADADGNGRVQTADVAAISQNFGSRMMNVGPDLSSLNPAANRATVELRGNVNASFLNLEIFLRNGQLPKIDFYGVAITLKYRPALVVGFQFSPLVNPWFDPNGNASHTLFMHRDRDARIELAVTRTDQRNIVGNGKIFEVRLLILGESMESIGLEVEKLALIDKDLNVIPVQIQYGSGGNPGTTTCPTVVDPVCGSDGRVYLNSCFAEKAGVTSYTQGVCNPECVDPTRINPNAVCPAVYDPVCGCNGKQYSNACEAERAGVRKWTRGTCGSLPAQCYDPTLIVNSPVNSLNPNTGVISFNPPNELNRVCGCNGVTYRNSVEAEAQGIRFYTKGACNTTCVDPTRMNPGAFCTAEYNPVCGCNGETYPNACTATAAGVVSFTPGACGSTSAWCNKAVPLSCGDFLSSETTVGAGNNIDQYPCSTKSYTGPEKVYVINKTTAGDLQIGLEILTAGLDLDLFLLAANCSQLTCVRSSTTNNSQSNKEGIVLEDAPIGTYYLVVDGSAAGQYRLELSCGYLDCRQAIHLTCGQPYNGSNLNGQDNVSLYGCSGNVLNVGNNGPEVVHTFTVTQAGTVTIRLTNLSANLELFLLRSCNRGACIAFSQNSGTSNEEITIHLQPGTYYAVVDGYNGAVSNYRLTVECAATCNLNLGLSATSATCGQSNGRIQVSISGGTPGYHIAFSGPVHGSYSTHNANSTINNLPAGNYTVTVTDLNGCKATQHVTVGSGGNLSAHVSVTNAVCGPTGRIQVTVNGGTAPFRVFIDGNSGQPLTFNTNSFSVTGLSGGSYTLHIIDANGCTVICQVTVGQSGSNFSFTATPTPAACEALGSIAIRTTNGTAPFKVRITGPKNGMATTNSANFNIINLPAGTYTVTVEDANWCTFTRTVVVGSTELNYTVVLQEGNCTQAGSITIHISSGKPTFTVMWSGPVSGSAATTNTSFTIPNLPSGAYVITVKDANWCEVSRTVHITSSTSNLGLSLVSQPAVCETPGLIGLDISGGKKPYRITWDGPGNNDGTTTTNSNLFEIPNLPPGNYTVTVEDANHCKIIRHTQVLTTSGNFGFSISTAENDCNATSNFIRINISGGRAPYKIMWDGPGTNDGNITTHNTTYTIPNPVAGTYSIRVTDANWCEVVRTVHITSGAPGLGLSLTPRNGICEMPGSIGVTISGGRRPYTIVWDGPGNNDGTNITDNTTFEIPNLPSGAYSVRVTDANGCIVTRSTQVTILAGNLTFITTTSENECGPNSFIRIDISGGTAPYKITWDGPGNNDGNITTNNPFYIIQNLVPGSYNIRVTDANWCFLGRNITLNPNTTNLFSANVTPVVCEMPGVIKLNLTGGAPDYKVTWSGPVSGTSFTSGNMLTISNLPKGTYTITVQDARGCVDTKTVQVIETQGDLDIRASLIANQCGQFNTIWLDVLGGTPTFMISWEGPRNGSIMTSDRGHEIFDLPPGKYTITVKDGNWCVVSTMITVYDTPGTLFEATPTKGVCENLGSIKLSFTGGAPTYQIAWSGPSPGSASTAANMFTIENLEAGTYTVQVTDSRGCTATRTVTVVQEDSEIRVETALITNDCGQFNTIWIDIFGGTAPYVVEWEGPTTGSDTIPTGAHEIMDLPPGKYTIVVKDSNWCFVTTMVTVFETPVNIFSATPNNSDCNQNGSIALTLTGTPNYSISWSGPRNGSATATTNTFTINDLPGGSYTITVRDGKDCQQTTTVTVAGGSGTLAATITGVNGSGSTLGRIRVNITAGAAPFVITISGPSSGNLTRDTLGQTEIENLPAGQYTVAVRDNNGCTVTQQLTITITEGVLGITVSQTGNTCGSTGAILVNISGGTPNYTISWSGNGSSGSAVTGSSSVTIQNLPPGTYTITVTGQNGGSDSKTVQVFANPSAMSLSVTVTNGACGQNGQLLLSIANGNGPFSIEWSGPTNNTATVTGNTYTISNLPSGTYTVKVTEAGGCSQTKTLSVTNTNQQPVANFSFAVNGTTVNFINQSSPGTYSWNFGDNTSANTSNPSHVFGNNSTYNVCLTVTNSCGSQTTCKSVTVGVPTSAALIDVKDLSGPTGSTIYVPVTIENCITGSLVSFAGSLSLSNPSVGTIVGIVPGSMSPQYNANNRTFSYFNNTGNGLPCGPGQILFYVAIQLTGSSGASAVLTITGTPLTIELGGLSGGVPASVPYAISSGVVSIANTARISGNIQTYWGAGLPNVEVTARHGSTNQMKMTDANGRYELPALPTGEMYTVQPKRDAQPENGLSTYALFAGQRFILGMEPLEITSPYQIIAGDANCDGRFTTLDLFLIQRIIIGVSEDFGNCPSWVFVKAGSPMPEQFDATNVFPYHNCDTLMLMKDTTSNFVGVKVGDILGHANPNGIVGTQLEPRSNGKLRLLANSRTLLAGGLLEIPVTSSNFVQIAGYQMGLAFDVNKLEFVDIVPSVNPTLNKLAVGNTDANKGLLRLSWFDLRGEGVTVASDEVIFTLRFRVKADVENLSEALAIHSRLIRKEAHTSQGDRLEVELAVNGTAILAFGANAQPTYKLYQNVPNPFGQTTYIGFDLPQDMRADLIIFDQFGKMVKTYSGDFTRGHNRIDLDRVTLSSGVYYYTLRAGDFADTKTMIVIE